MILCLEYMYNRSTQPPQRITRTAIIKRINRDRHNRGQKSKSKWRNPEIKQNLLTREKRNEGEKLTQSNNQADKTGV